MPIATSPYQQNDYTALSARQPYRLNIQAVAQTAMALDQFWKRGAERVKSAYDSVLNLNLTSDENREVQKQFMEDAQKQLTKLASMDLSDPSIQRQGLGIFKPIFNDSAIMQDDYLTKLKSNIFSEAEEHKRDPKTKGAGFHMDNLAYALKGFKGFNNTTARNQIGDVYQKAKDSQYIPFYDDSKEKIDILKACKGNKLSNMTQNAGYLETYSNGSLADAKLYGCLEAGLSQQSRQQNRISAAVRYGEDYEAVRNDYIQSASGKRDYYEVQKLKLAAQREALSKVAGNETQVAELDGEIKMLDAHVEKLKKELSTYASWDGKFLQDNYEDLAANAYFQRTNGAFAAAFATSDIQRSLKADPIYITHYVQNELNKRQAVGFDAAIDLENLKFQHDLLSGKTKDGKTSADILTRIKACAADINCRDKIGTFLNEAYNEPATTSNKIKAEIRNFTGQKFNIIKDLKNDPFVKGKIGDLDPGDDITNYNEGDYKKMWSILNDYVNAADNSDPNKQRLIDVTNRLLEIDNRNTVLKSILDDATAAVGVDNSEIQKKYQDDRTKLISSTKAIKLENGTILPAERIADTIEGSDPEFSIQRYDPQGVVAAVEPVYNIVTKDGKRVASLDRRIIEKYTNLNDSRRDGFRSKLDEYLGQNTVVQKMGLATGDLFTKDSPGETYLKTAFGNSLGIIGETVAGGGVVFNSVGGLDATTGKVRLQATNKDGQVSFKDMRDAMAKSGIASSLYGERIDDTTMEITLPDAIGIIPEPKYSDVLRLQLNYLEKKAPTLPNNGVLMQVGKDRTGTSYSIRVKRKLGYKTPEYTIIGVNPQGKAQELPFLNTNQIDPKENVLGQLDRLLNGVDKLTPKE